MKSRCLLVLPCMLALAALAQADRIATRFKQLDKNKDGKLSADELKDHPQLQALLKGADKDKDGFLTLEEVRAHLARFTPKARVAKAAPSTPARDSVREGPQPLASAAAGVGRMVPDAVLKDLDGREVKVSKLLGKNGLVVAFTSTTCPICKKYGPTLARLEEALAAKGVNVLFVNPTANEKPDDIRAFQKTHKIKGAY